MAQADRDTIVALASPAGPARRALIRVSGEGTLRLLERCLRLEGQARLAELPRGAYAAQLDDGRGLQPVWLLWMPGPRSYTGEDTAELHLLGSPPLCAAALRRLYACGARPAEPGEFTRRAFASGRIDLARAEGILALVEAASSAERRAASTLLLGGLSEHVARAREALLGLQAGFTASLDFEELETGAFDPGELERLVQEASGAVERALGTCERSQARADLPRVVLVGRSSSGKSSLFNRLQSSERALVAAEPGTTRDPLRAPWRAGGRTCLLVDTAGLDDPVEPRRRTLGPGEIERAAAELALLERSQAELLLWTLDLSDPAPLGERLAQAAERLRLARSEVPAVLVGTKLDLVSAERGAELRARALEGGWLGAKAAFASACAVSSTHGTGLAELEREVAAGLWPAGQALESAHSHALCSAQRAALERARARIADALAARAEGQPADLLATHFQRALACLDEVDGHSGPEDLLDRIFTRFCVGK